MPFARAPFFCITGAVHGCGQRSSGRMRLLIAVLAVLAFAGTSVILPAGAITLPSPGELAVFNGLTPAIDGSCAGPVKLSYGPLPTQVV